MNKFSAPGQQIIANQLSETLHFFSKAFSCAVTETWPEDGSFLAKHGSDSVYSLFESIFPQVNTLMRQCQITKFEQNLNINARNRCFRF